MSKEKEGEEEVVRKWGEKKGLRGCGGEGVGV